MDKFYISNTYILEKCIKYLQEMDVTFIIGVDTLSITFTNDNIKQRFIEKLEKDTGDINYNHRAKTIGESGFPSPIINEIKHATLNHNEIKKLLILGSYFTKSTTVNIEGLVINTTNVINDHEIEIEVVSGAINKVYNLSVQNHSGITNLFEAIKVELSIWLDLREGGDSFSTGIEVDKDIKVKSGMTVNRDSEGMFFTGVGNWTSWVKMQFLKWNRGEDKVLQWIMTRPTGAMMIGIGSTETNEGSGSQYAEAENEAYFNSGTNLWGLYGNNGTPGSAANQSDGTSIAGGTGFFKLKFTKDGEPNGGVFTLYSLPSGDDVDWDDETTVLKTITISGGMTANASVIMPFATVQSGGSQRFIALKVE